MSNSPEYHTVTLKRELAHMIAEWEVSDELPGDFADRLLAFFRARKSELSESERHVHDPTAKVSR